MNDLENLLEAIEHPLSIVFDDLVVRLGEETGFPNQVRQTELHDDGRILHISTIGTVVIRAQQGFTF